MTPDESHAWRLATKRAAQGRTWESTAWLLCCCFPSVSAQKLHQIAKVSRLAWLAGQHQQVYA